MIVIRDIFQLKFGKAKPAMELFKKGEKMMKESMTGKYRVYTDFTGPSYRLIMESEFESLSSMEAEMQKDMSNTEWKNWYEEFKPLVDSSYREILRLVE